MLLFLQDFHKNKLVRPVTYAPPSCSQPEDSLIQDLVSTVEKSMKRNADSIMRFLEGISSRLSQLELYCYNLDKSIGEMRSELTRDHDEADVKLKSLEKHVQEVSCFRKYNFVCIINLQCIQEFTW